MERNSEDAFLVARAQEGYLDAYDDLLRRHIAPAYRIALRLLGNRHDAEDVTQEAMIAAWQQLPRFRGESSFSTWLYRIVTRRALNKINRARPDTSLEAEPPEFSKRVADRAPGPLEQVQRSEAVDAITAAVAALPAAQRIAIVLHHFEGLSVAEVAEITGSTVAATRSQLFRGRRTLVTTLHQWR